MQAVESQYNIYFEEFLDKFKAEPPKGKTVAIFMSSLEENGIYWCPDCENARDNVNNIIIPKCNEKGWKFFHVNVGDKPTWKNPEHPLRTNLDVNISRIPILAIFEGVNFNNIFLIKIGKNCQDFS